MVLNRGEVPVTTLEKLTEIYGPIYKVKVGPVEMNLIGSFETCDELCDETRFFKTPPPALVDETVEGARGLFAINSEKDEDWGTAHRVLMPAFGPLAIEVCLSQGDPLIPQRQKLTIVERICLTRCSTSQHRCC